MANFYYSYEEKYAGKAVAVVDGAAYGDFFDGEGTVFSANKGAYVNTTGFCVDLYDKNRIKYVQTVEGFYILLDYKEDELAWAILPFDEAQRKEIAKSQPDAQKYVDQIIKDNAQIIQNNLLCARFADRLTKNQKQILYNLQKRLTARNASLLNDGLVAQVQTSQPAGYANLQASLQSFMSKEPEPEPVLLTGCSYPQGVGIVLTGTAVIVISCVVIASLATAAYYAYKAMAKDSAQDVKFSDKLTKTLVSKLTQDEYQQLLQETKGIVTKNSILQRIKGSYHWLAVAALAAFGVWGTRKILQQAK